MEKGLTHRSGQELILQTVLIVSQELDGMPIDAEDDGVDEGQAGQRAAQSPIQSSHLVSCKGGGNR